MNKKETNNNFREFIGINFPFPKEEFSISTFSNTSHQQSEKQIQQSEILKEQKKNVMPSFGQLFMKEYYSTKENNNQQELKLKIKINYLQKLNEEISSENRFLKMKMSNQQTQVKNKKTENLQRQIKRLNEEIIYIESQNNRQINVLQKSIVKLEQHNKQLIKQLQNQFLSQKCSQCQHLKVILNTLDLQEIKGNSVEDVLRQSNQLLYMYRHKNKKLEQKIIMFYNQLEDKCLQNSNLRNQKEALEHTLMELENEKSIVFQQKTILQLQIENVKLMIEKQKKQKEYWEEIFQVQKANHQVTMIEFQKRLKKYIKKIQITDLQLQPNQIQLQIFQFLDIIKIQIIQLLNSIKCINNKDALNQLKKKIQNLFINQNKTVIQSQKRVIVSPQMLSNKQTENLLINILQRVAFSSSMVQTILQSDQLLHLFSNLKIQRKKKLSCYKAYNSYNFI